MEQKMKNIIEKDEVQSKEYTYRLIKDLCNTIMFDILSVYDKKENYLEEWLEMLKYNKEQMVKIVSLFPNTHPVVKYFNRVRTLRDDQYDSIKDILTEKINKYYSQERPFSINIVDCQKEVEIISEIIIDSTNYTTIDEYVNEKAKEDNKRFLYLLGKSVYYGLNCKPNKKEGEEYLKRSALKGYEYAKYELAKIWYEQKDINNAKRMIEEQLLNSQDLFIAGISNNLLGKIYYYRNNEIQQNYEMAWKCFNNSYSFTESKEHIGKMYYFGYFVSKDYTKAFEIFSSINKSRLALHYLAEMYRGGKGVERSYEMAFKYDKESAEKDYPMAEYSLAKSYLLGIGTEKNVEKAIYWLEECAKWNYGYAQYTLGLTYYYGVIVGVKVPVDRERGIELLTKASEDGIIEAKQELEIIQNKTHSLEKTDFARIEERIISIMSEHMGLPNENYDNTEK